MKQKNVMTECIVVPIDSINKIKRILNQSMNTFDNYEHHTFIVEAIEEINTLLDTPMITDSFIGNVNCCINIS